MCPCSKFNQAPNFLPITVPSVSHAHTEGKREDNVKFKILLILYYRYSTSPPIPQIQYVQYPAPAVAPPPVQKEEELLEDPPRLFMKDEDTGRYVLNFQ
jgi:hypothetical protein